MKSTVLIMLSCCLLSAHGSAQTAFEEFLEQMVGEAELSESLEQLEELWEHPLDINRVSVAELQRIPLVTPVLAARIIALRRQRGGFTSKEDLLEVKGMSDDFLHYLSYFIMVNIQPPQRLWRLQLRGRGAGNCAPTESDGFNATPLSPVKTYLRFSLQYGEWVRIGTVFEKDAGEERLDDYSAFFLSASIPQLNTRVLFGSYALTFGQGLLFWGAYGYGRGADPVLPARRSASPLKPYASVDENSGLRGVALESTIASLSICGFLSRTSLDATVTPSGTVSSLYTAGLHRTENELAKKDVLGERLQGGRIDWHCGDWLRLATAYYASGYSVEVINSDSLRNRFAFRGRRNKAWSIEGDATISKFNLFAEIAGCASGGRARSGGVIFDCSPVKMILHLRDYGRDYYNVHAQAFSHGSGDVKNERGTYIGLSWKLHDSLKLAMYHESYHKPWRTYLLPLPSGGEESYLQCDYMLRHGLQISARGKFERTPSLISYVDEYGRVESLTVYCKNLKIRGQLTFQATRSVLLKIRLEKCFLSRATAGNAARYHESKSSMLLYQDAQLRFSERLSGYLRLAFFDAGDYDVRLYAYENDLPGVATSRCFAGRGTHWYFLCHYRLKSVSFSIKCTSTYFEDRVQEMDMGADRVGITEYSISAQCDVTWK